MSLALSPLRRRPLALMLSIALNAFLVALVAAHLLAPRLAAGGPAPRGGMVGRIIAVLPPEDAIRFQAQLDAGRPRYQPARDRIDAARHVLVETMAADPYNDAAVRAALTDYQDSWRAFSRQFDDVFLAALAALPPAVRAHVARAADQDSR
jgi:uncharacterized membrane protein